MGDRNVGHSIVRYDPVTARAISRLSHGVARLHANPDLTINHCAFRSRKRNVDRESRFVKNSSFHGDCIRHAPTGSKRKWQSDKTGSHVSMQVDGTGCGYQPAIRRPALPPPMDCTGTSTLCFPASELTDKFMRSDPSDRPERYSSCSSMLSITTSSGSDKSEDSSRENEADDEGAEERDRVGVPITTTDHVYTDLLTGSTPSFPLKTDLSTRRYVNLSQFSRPSTCGGDSSDGVSVSIKIPRLSHFSSAFTSTVTMPRRSSHSIRNSKYRSVIMNTCCMTQKSHHDGRPLKPHKRRESSSLAVRSRVHTRPQFLSSRCDICACDSSSGTSFSEGSPSPNLKRVSSENFGDLADDEQSDFPTEESMSHKNRNVLRSSLTWSTGLFMQSDTTASVIPHPKRTPAMKWFEGSASGLACMIDEVDSDLEEIFTDTWPLLSQRAKWGYAKGIARSGIRQVLDSHSSLSSREKPRASRRKFVAFVPSKLGRLCSNGNEHFDASLCRSPKNRMPTPPWIDQGTRSDSELLLFSDDLQTQNTNSELRMNRFAALSKATPILQDNVGHQLLRRLGWEPGTGLGTNNQGQLDPVGCAAFYVHS